MASPPPSKRRIAGLASAMQAVALAAHAALYFTWVFFWQAGWPVAVGLGLLSVSFVGASLLAFRSYAGPVRWLYRGAAAWLGLAMYLLIAFAACWIAYAVALLFDAGVARAPFADVAAAAALLIAGYGFVNAARPRLKRRRIRLAGLGEAWVGKTVFLASDLHLGHVRGPAFARRVARLAADSGAELVLLAGDVFDGTPAPWAAMVAPWKEVHPRHGAFFVAGNHEGLSPRAYYLDALRAAGVRVLQGEAVDLDGLQLIGVGYGEAVRARTLAEALQRARIDRARASILMTHAPDHPELAAAAGIGLQVNGHTHGGQTWPFTGVVRRVYGRFAYGLHALGPLQVLTTYGAGTWGPPFRVGTHAEVVLIELDRAG